MGREKVVVLNGLSTQVASEAGPTLYQMLAEGASDVLVLLSPDHRRLYISPSCQEVMGYSAEELLGGRADGLVHEEDLGHVALVMGGMSDVAPVAQTAWRMRCRDGSFRWMESRYRRLPGGNVVTGIRDIQDRKEIEGQLKAALDRVERLAMEDQLTGLPNRRCFIEAVERQALHASPGCGIALMMLDLDDFKAINDRFGHMAGDAVLVEAGRRLRTAVSGHVVARLGGDEFAILVSAGDPREIDEIAAAAVKAVIVPVQFGLQSLKVGVSIGIALCPEHGAHHRVLISNADAAMYRIKRVDGNRRYCFYDPAIDDESVRTGDLRRALSDGQVVPYYQPLVSLADGEVVAFEALARWIHPVDGCLLPEQFMHLVDSARLHDELFAAIVSCAAADAVSWPAPTRLCLNVSPTQLSSRTFPASVVDLLSRAGLSPSRVTLEVTETQPITDWTTARAVFEELRHRGIRMVLDDFGIGHSGLKTLQQLRFDGLKVDRSFIGAAFSGQCPTQYFAAIVDLGRKLNLEITAEGIETEENARLSGKLGCTLGQGFLYGRPVPCHLVAAVL